MQSEQIKNLAVSALEDLKGLDIRVLDVMKASSIMDYMVIASGRSDRHVKSLASNVVKLAKANAMPPLGVEGERQGDWVLVDLGDVIVHIMRPQVRDFYNLEKLWDENIQAATEARPSLTEYSEANQDLHSN